MFSSTTLTIGECHLAPVTALACLEDRGSPVGACPDLHAGWAERTLGSLNAPAFVQALCEAQPIVTCDVGDTARDLVVLGRERLVHARTAASLAEVRIQRLSCEPEVALLLAAYDLMHSSALYTPPKRGGMLVTYFEWLRDVAKYNHGGIGYPVTPVVRTLLDATSGQGLAETIATIAHCTSRNLRYRSDRPRRPRANAPWARRADSSARVLVEGRVSQVIDSGDLESGPSNAGAPYQRELPFTL